MEINMMKRIISGILAIIALLAVCASAVSCAPPKLEEVKDTFARLIADSAEVNRILFGEGLSVYGDMSFDEATGIYYSVFYTKENGKLCAYYDKATGEYVTLRYGDKGDTRSEESEDEMAGQHH